MKNQLIQYVDLLFAGAPGTEDIKQEILQNTLDRYDDLISQGKAPEAAYRLAISGIGDISEILGAAEPQVSPAPAAPAEKGTDKHKGLRAIAIGLYICCPIPLIILSQFGLDILGLCLLLFMVAAATAILICTNNDDAQDEPVKEPRHDAPEDELRESIYKLIRYIGLAIYFALSFVTSAWHITWLVFPLMGAVKGLARAILDLKEANNHEA